MKIRYSPLLLISAAVALGLSPARAAQPAFPRPDTPAVEKKVNQLLSKLTLEQKIDLLSGLNMYTKAMPQIGLPRLKMSDATVGVRVWGPSIAYAAGIGLAASWNPALAHEVGVAIGQDARARGVNILLGPGADMYRSPLCGRNFEYVGEDPYLASQILIGYIEGLQSQDVVATIKHYAVNDAEYDRHNENAIVSERALRDFYLPDFEAAVKQARVGAVMSSYNLINGEHSTENKHLNLDILDKDWGFKGILMSDWGATYNGVASANAGLDLEMPFGAHMNAKTLLPAIKDGQVSVATIDDKVRRLLRIAVEFDFLEPHQQTVLSNPIYGENSLIPSLHAAEESVVLLKNNGQLLPIDPNRVHTIALIGPDAYPTPASAGGSAHVTAIAPVSILQGLTEVLGTRGKVLWNSGVKTAQDIFASTSGGFMSGKMTFVTPTKDLGYNPVARYTGTTPPYLPGFEEEEFPNSDFSGKPTATRWVPQLDGARGNQWAPPSGRHVSYRFTALYTPRAAGPQRFIAAGVGEDTYQLRVNGKLVLEETPHEGQSPQWVDLNLPAGKPAAVEFDYVPSSGRLRAGLGVVPADQMLEPNVRKIARLADVAVVSVGYTPQTEGEGHDRTYSLPPGQARLIRAVEAANPRTIVVITSGGSVSTRKWINSVPAVIEDWYGGTEGGRALANVLLGNFDPSGKLPISWEKRLKDNPTMAHYYEEPGTHNVHYKEGVFVGYRYYDESTVKPLFPFGFGLSYTTFAFSHLTVTPKVASPDGPITVSFDVQNTGQHAGAEVAQVYVGDPSARIKRPLKQLKGFERVELNPGETRRVTVTLNRRSLAYWDVNKNGWQVDPGKFAIYVGDSSENVPLQESFTVR